MEKMEKVLEALAHIRCSASAPEARLHEQTAEALRQAGIAAYHEVKLGPGARIDFVACGVGIEVKKKRPERAKLLAQLARYAACDEIKSLIVIAPRGIDLPKTIGGKTVRMVALEKLWGISLP